MFPPNHTKPQKYESIFKAFLYLQYETSYGTFFSKVALCKPATVFNKDPQRVLSFEFSEAFRKTLFSYQHWGTTFWERFCCKLLFIRKTV